ncbi:MAG: hypothetical protein QF921_17785 [Pseudomonadales bacterium]|jgi:hypothetical protein|nr:hypothetical protein [Pseudomonadales bacterium]MDP6470393.1 hypothetical protein [Pseudomonadales bacterium]MDP6827693.1 hypothetical protein [Pseudomonadales bacterium]MDP6973338.1 hypothetical protein [Pseudomonadales bacterium]|tara:strand:+ start:2093 stop:2284 length:192 start_codon:yes stop_codon:yes gene_type:complete
MPHVQELCKGRIFKREGYFYIVTEHRPKSANCLPVRRIDATRKLQDMPVAEVIDCLGHEVVLD